MRNVFDQYSQQENRLTHALMCALVEDKRLLRCFIRWITGKDAPKHIEIVEQRLPCEPELSEDESERRGLPDAWIFDANNWSLLIESKVAAILKNDQLYRHLKTASRRGFTDITLLAIHAVQPKHKLPANVIFKKWSQIYTWLCQSNDSGWALKTARYLEVAESKWSGGYLKEGALTAFSGIPFSDDNPYNYPDAKRLLRLAISELRTRKDVVSKLHINPQGVGRGAIKGRDGVGVWDFLRLKESKNEQFTKYPHLTLALENDRIVVMMIVPDEIKKTFRKNIIKLGFEGFCELMAQVNNNLHKALCKAKGAAPWVVVLQRRSPKRSSTPIIDASIEYDLRTAFSSQGEQSVKVQQEWFEATYEALKSKRSNLQLGVGAIFPYGACEVTRHRNIINFIADTWISCKPLLDVMLKSQDRLHHVRDRNKKSKY